MNLKQIHSVYFIGIGGIGMSNLARYMMHIGKKVTGYDKTPSSLTQALEEEGIAVRYDIDLDWILNQNFDNHHTLIVYTPAVKQQENRELDYFLNNNFKVVKRSELLGVITKNTICLAVAGTHGKTTTSCMLGHILKEAEIPATSFLGGISENYHTNLILGGTKYFVVEADEYDRSFLRLHPDYACITATDADHLDIYKDADDFHKTFQEFAALVSEKLFIKNGLELNGVTYGIEDGSDYEAINIRIIDGAYVFDVKTPDNLFLDFRLQVPGRHNVLNCLAATALAHEIGVSGFQIAKSIESFKGVERRFSYRINNEKLVLIDDYAHHPTELNALYNAVSEMYPNEKLTIFFQPHTFSRTKDFEEGFVNSLRQFDSVFLLPIYAAREHPLMGITSQALVAKINQKIAIAEMIEPSQIFEKIKAGKHRIIMMVGAGDIGEMITKVTKQLESI